MKQFERDYEQCKKVMDRRLNQNVLETGAKYDEQVEQKAPVLLSVGKLFAWRRAVSEFWRFLTQG